MSVAAFARLSTRLKVHLSIQHAAQRPCSSKSLQELDASESEVVKPKPIRDFAADSARVNCAVYAAGLTKSGALSIRSLVVQPRQPHMLKKPQRITFMNTRKIRRVAAGFGFSLFASPQHLYGSGLNNFGQLGGTIQSGAPK